MGRHSTKQGKYPQEKVEMIINGKPTEVMTWQATCEGVKQYQLKIVIGLPIIVGKRISAQDTLVMEIRQLQL